MLGFHSNRSLLLMVVGCLFAGMVVNWAMWHRVEPAPISPHGVAGISPPPLTCPPPVIVGNEDPELEVGNHAAGTNTGERASTKHRKSTNKAPVQSEEEPVDTTSIPPVGEPDKIHLMLQTSALQEEPEGVRNDEDFTLLQVGESLSSVARGIRTFTSMCLYPDSERLLVLPREKAEEKAKTRKCASATASRESTLFVDIPGDSFILRDVCALGHFPKDLTHYDSWVEDEREAVKKAGSRPDGGAGEDDPARYVILGHRCVSKDPKVITNKRSPVFRDVLRHWVDAVVGHSVLDDGKTPAKAILDAEDERKTEANQQGEKSNAGMRKFMFYEDVEELLDKGHPKSKVQTLLCFNRILERHETWRWFPSQQRVHGFRLKLWKYFNLLGTHEALKKELVSVPFAKQRKAQVMVLRRDEDRHFEEAKVAKFLESNFGSVARIVYTQFDKPPPQNLKPSNDIPVPTFAEQVSALFHTDVLLAAHGAALSSMVFLRPGTVVVELFPHNFRYYMYEELALLLGLRYVPAEGSVVAPPKCCKARNPLLEGGAADAKGKPAAAALLTAGQLEAKNIPVGEAGVKSMKELNGLRDCKKCDISLTNSEWYYIVKSALSSIWLRNSRFSDVHHFDIRR
jgi:hypothetical protein